MLCDIHSTTRDAKKIIVVDLGFLGDTLHLVPALWEIKDHYPNAALHVLTSPVGCEVLRMVDCVTKAWAFPLGPPSPPWWRHWGVVRVLRREKFDVAFNFSGADRTVFVTAAIGARESVGYQGARKHFWQLLLIRHWIPRRSLPSPMYKARREILSWCGFTLKPPRFDLNVPQADRDWAASNVPTGAVHFSINASHALKEWPLNNCIQLIRSLFAGAGMRVVVTAAQNPREQERLERVRREVMDERLTLIGGPLSITRLAAVIQRCALHCGPDSGVLHVAAALGVPTVAIFRRYPDMKDWLPEGPQHANFDAPCPCMETKEPPCRATGEAACLGSIPADLIATHIRRTLAQGPSSGTSLQNKS